MSPFELVCVCASHITNARRLWLLRAMIRSWARQTCVPPLYVSVSWEPSLTPLIARAWADVLHDDGSPGTLVILQQGAVRKSQFEHYNAILKRLHKESEGREMWLMFSDDDDLWSEIRAETVVRSLNNLLAGRESFLSVKMGGTVEGDYDGETSASVDSALAAGDLRVAALTAEDYWMYVCRRASLADFIERASAELLAHRFCDLYFVKYLRYSAGFKTVEVPSKAGDPWLYAYRGSNYGGGRVTDNKRLTADTTGVRDLMVLVYTTMPSRRCGIKDHSRKANAYGMTDTSMIAFGTQMVQQGQLDAFVFSPMPVLPGGKT